MDEPIKELSWFAAATPILFGAFGFHLRARAWSQIEGPEDPGLAQRYAGGVLLFFAPLEGAAMFNLIVWVLVGGALNPIAAAVAWAIMVANVPSNTQLHRAAAT